MAESADQRLDRLFEGLPNYERTRSLAAEWSLDGMHAILGALGLGAPGLGAPGFGAESLPGCRVQVAGSKGKGTTVLYLEALARAAGLRTGAFVSPHLEHVTERVRIDGEPVGASRLVEVLERVIDVAASVGCEPSFFEAITAAAVLAFREAGCELVALEVGLGGRLDATTAVPVDATIVTHIELEHGDLLGDTLEAIATEKAHVMRPGKPALVLPDPRLDALFRAHAASVGARWVDPPQVRLEGVGTDCSGDTVTGAGTGCVGDLVTGARDGCFGDLVTRAGSGTVVERFSIPDGSGFEAAALALAYGCLRELRPDARICVDPVARPQLPGRFESIPDGAGGWPTVLDGAHTPGSSAMVAEELRRRFPGRPVAVLYATARGKLWREGLSAFLPLTDRVFVTSLAGTTGVPPEEVVAWLRQQGVNATVVAGPADGFEELRRSAAVRLVVGSFYLVGAVRRLARNSNE